MGRGLRRGPSNDAEPDRSAAGDDDSVVEADLPRSTACRAQDSGSANAACAGWRLFDTL